MGHGANVAHIEDTFDLSRFVDAQVGVYEDVLAELRAGEKRSHWIWFIFPQMKGLGRSPQAHYFGIGSLDEARAYWSHPLLGPRLDECTRLVNLVEGRSIHEIFGSPDEMKFRSSMTLFSRAAEDCTVFNEALRKYFDGVPDAMTLELLRA
jgi:uncharacterized protein (DUF1810 family)